METIFKKERPEIVNHHAAIAEVGAIRCVIRSRRSKTNVLGIANVFSHSAPTATTAAEETGGSSSFLQRAARCTARRKSFRVDENRTPDHALALRPFKTSGRRSGQVLCTPLCFDYFIFRYANVYGPRQNPKGEAGVVAIFGELIK